MAIKPCLTCTRVKNPSDCEIKSCKEWRSWFVVRWDAMRKGVFASMQQAPVTEDVIRVGGHKYSHPDRVREYIRSGNPCASCACPKELCDTPCQVRKVWDKRRKEDASELEGRSQGEIEKV